MYADWSLLRIVCQVTWVSLENESRAAETRTIIWQVLPFSIRDWAR